MTDKEKIEQYEIMHRSEVAEAMREAEMMRIRAHNSRKVGQMGRSLQSEWEARNNAIFWTIIGFLFAFIISPIIISIFK